MYQTKSTCYVYHRATKPIKQTVCILYGIYCMVVLPTWQFCTMHNCDRYSRMFSSGLIVLRVWGSIEPTFVFFSHAEIWKWWPVNSPHKGPVTRKLFPFDGAIMILAFSAWLALWDGKTTIHWWIHFRKGKLMWSFDFFVSPTICWKHSRVVGDLNHNALRWAQCSIFYISVRILSTFNCT